MVGAVFDTNIIIDYLAGFEPARAEIDRFSRKAMSVITWAEVMVGAETDVEAATRDFLRRFDVLLVDQDIAEEAVRLRREHRIKLPDALIWATARTHSLLLVTRDAKDFPTHDPDVRMPYELR